MNKKLLNIGLLALSLSVQSQVLTYVNDGANMYVSNGTLVYNGGGLQTTQKGLIDLYGNMMIVGNNSTDVLKTVTTAGDNKTDGGNIILHLNSGTPTTATYGQLYITGLPQANITGIVDKEYAAVNQGAYQQIGIPFNGKTFYSLGVQLGGGTNAFDNSRWKGKEILKWSNDNIVFDGSTPATSPITSATQAGITMDALSTTASSTNSTAATDRTAYFSVGTKGWATATLRTVNGVPYADGLSGTNKIKLNSAPQLAVDFGAGGNNRNNYLGKYNSYVFEQFDTSSSWSGTWGKFYYQFSNPYFTNLDLSRIVYIENNAVTDNNNIGASNIYGILINPNGTAFASDPTTNYAATQKVTFNADGTPNGDPNLLVIKPLGTFKIKLRNSTNQELDFDNLRRFNYTARAATTSYDVTAAKGNKNKGTVKQLGVIALDAKGNRMGETYYVVSPSYETGYIANPSVRSVQAIADPADVIQTFEESATGSSVDENHSSEYRLYINEANEVDYLGKKIDMTVYGKNVASLKFEVRENAQLIDDKTHALSDGVGFYYTSDNGKSVQVKQGDVIPVKNSNYGLYYGAPKNSSSLNNTTDVKPQSRTLITYNPSVENYVVRFDPAWKSAAIEVYDASGKLVVSEKQVKTDTDFVIKLDSSAKAVYVAKVTGNDGTVVNSKILIK